MRQTSRRERQTERTSRSAECKKSNRFLAEVNIEEYLEALEKEGIVQEIPIKITIPCKSCKQIEVYNIYKNKYVFVDNLTKKFKWV